MKIHYILWGGFWSHLLFCTFFYLFLLVLTHYKGHMKKMKYRKIFCSRYTHVSNVPERAETEVKVVTRRNHDISIPVRRYSLEGRFWFAQFESLQTPQWRGGHLPTAQPLQPPFLVGPTYCHPVPIPGTLRPHATRPLKTLRALQMHGFVLGPNVFQILYFLK